jgi:hypothetical protein
LPQKWNEFNIAHIYKKGNKIGRSVYRVISLLPTTYKILSNILISGLIPCVEKIIGDHRCGFRRNVSATEQIFCIRQILEKEREYNGRLHQLLIDSEAYDSVRTKVLYNIVMELSKPIKLIRLIKTCLNETYSKIRLGEKLFDAFPIQNGLKKEMLYCHCFSILH